MLVQFYSLTFNNENKFILKQLNKLNAQNEYHFCLKEDL